MELTSAGTAQTTAELIGMKIIKLCEDTNEINIAAATTSWGQPSGDLTGMPVVVQRYSPRTWAVYCDGELLCVTEYLKGARAVQALVERFQAELRQARSIEPASEPMDFTEVSTTAGA